MWPFCATNLLAVALVAQAISAPAIAEKPEAPIDALIPWLLEEDAQLCGIPFGEVIFDATGKKVIPIDSKNETDRRVIKEIARALDEVVRRLNEPGSVI